LVLFERVLVLVGSTVVLFAMHVLDCNTQQHLHYNQQFLLDNILLGMKMYQIFECIKSVDLNNKHHLFSIKGAGEERVKVERVCVSIEFEKDMNNILSL
jgi:hypothetical protein